jgi:hypothetical protein
MRLSRTELGQTGMDPHKFAYMSAKGFTLVDASCVSSIRMVSVFSARIYCCILGRRSLFISGVID